MIAKHAWVGFSGGRMGVTSEIETLIRTEVAQVMERGDAFISGGALGVDSIALDEALRHDPSASRIRVFLPTSLDFYATLYFKRA